MIKDGSSLYVALPLSYCKAKGIKKERVTVGINEAGTKNVVVPAGTVVPFWEWLGVGGLETEPIAIPIGNGGAVSIPVGSTLSVGIITNANSAGTYDTVTFQFADSSTGLSYSIAVGLHTSVQTGYTQFITEAPLLGGETTAQIPKFGQEVFSFVDMLAKQDGQSYSYQMPSLYANGYWVQFIMSQSPLDTNVKNNFYNAAYKTGETQGYTTETWQNSNYWSL